MKDLKSRSSVATREDRRSPVRLSCSPRQDRSFPPNKDGRLRSLTVGAYASRADRYEALVGIHVHSPRLVPARFAASRQRPLPRAGVEGKTALDPRGGAPRDANSTSGADAGAYVYCDPGGPREHSIRALATPANIGHATPSRLPRPHHGAGAKPIPRADARAVPKRAQQLKASPFPETFSTRTARSSAQVTASAAIRKTASLEPGNSELDATRLPAPAKHRSGAALTSGNGGKRARGRQSDPWLGEVAERIPGPDLGSTLEVR